jgi:hypothetical protein
VPVSGWGGNPCQIRALTLGLWPVDPLATDRMRTSINPRDPYRPFFVRQAGALPLGMAAALLAASLASPLTLAAPGASLGIERQQAAGWLQSREDQQTYRKSLEPPTPGQAAALDALERRQQLQWKAMERRQGESLQLRQRLGRLPGPPAGRRGAGEIGLRRRLERERLDMRLQRDMLPSPAPPSPIPGGSPWRLPPGFGPASGIIP